MRCLNGIRAAVISATAFLFNKKNPVPRMGNRISPLCNLNQSIIKITISGFSQRDFCYTATGMLCDLYQHMPLPEIPMENFAA